MVENFNWGAFLFNFVWGIKYRKWALLAVPFLCFVPYIGIPAALIMAYWAGKNGNQWAWEEVSYKDKDDFHEGSKSMGSSLVCINGDCLIPCRLYILVLKKT